MGLISPRPSPVAARHRWRDLWPSRSSATVCLDGRRRASSPERGAKVVSIAVGGRAVHRWSRPLSPF